MPRANGCDWAELLQRLDGFAFEYRQTTLHILGDGLFASGALDFADKDALFTLTAKKILCLIGESSERAAMINAVLLAQRGFQIGAKGV